MLRCDAATLAALCRRDKPIGVSFCRRQSVLEFYHNINSGCAQKVRIALERDQEVKEHLLTLQVRPERSDLNEIQSKRGSADCGACNVFTEFSLLLY